MIPGIAGHLIPATCLERWLTADAMAPSSSGSEFGKAAVIRQQAHRRFRAWRRDCARLGPASSLRALAEIGAGPLARVLGFEPAGTCESMGDVLVMDLIAAGVRTPCVVGAWGVGLERVWREVSRAGRARGVRWTLFFSGTHLGLMDATGAGPQRHLVFDLLAAEDARCFAALWITARADVVAEADGGATRGLATLVAQADVFATDVCRALREGVLAASESVVTALASGQGRGGSDASDVTAAFDQALTVVYRLLFLLFAESRALVPTWHPVYRQSYSIDSLRTAAEQGRSAGLWAALRAISRIAQAGCRTNDLVMTAFNGRLFDAARAPLIERRSLDDEAARRAVLALTTSVSAAGRGREPIAYGDLGVEQLGAVYETLLDYAPKRRMAGSVGGRRRTVIVLERGSDARKSSGSFYTPQPLARYLVSRTLGPLVQDRRPEEILSLAVVDPSAGSGAFLVEACQYLASAYEEALIATGGCLAEDVGPAERASMRRLIAEQCLFGVDVNPMAVQLTRLSLWLVTLAWNKPLSFLDHHVRTGDSLVGASLDAIVKAPTPFRRRTSHATLPLFDANDFAETARATLPVRRSLAGPSETLSDVRAKERALGRLDRPDSMVARWRRVADLWCAQWFDEGVGHASAFRDLSEIVLTGRGALPEHVARRALERAAATATAHRFFHWELEFPEVFFDVDGRRRPDGGFDAVIGNPPWDMMRADSGSSEDRGRARAALSRTRHFARDAGIYDAQSDGHSNRYQLFLERSVALLRDGGRFGLVLPGGLATDHGSARIRRMLFSRCGVDGFVGFDNRRAVFPIHRSVRFLLVTATKGAPTQRFGVRLGEVDPAVLDAAGMGDEPYSLELSTALLASLSGGELAIPFVRSQRDLSIAERAAGLFPPLGSSRGWGARFGRELNATDDRSLFGSATSGLPVVEGRQINPFSVRIDLATRFVSRGDASRRLGGRWRRHRLAYRDVASATNRLTLIAGVLPPDTISTHTVFCLRTPMSLVSQYFLCGLFNSYVVNYLVRLWVNTHVTTAIVEGLPLPRRLDAPAAFREIAACSRQLIGGSVKDRVCVLARLNARVAALFQLSPDEFAHVVSTFPLIPLEERNQALVDHRTLL